MPFYQVYHSYPLNDLHRRLLAARITTLHCEAFNAPRFLVHVRFFPENSPDYTYFVGGVSHSSSSNRIVGLVRTSASRSKEEFDKLAEAIEKGWNEILGVDVPKHNGDEWGFKEEEKELMMVTFTGMVTIRERGLTIPEAAQNAESAAALMEGPKKVLKRKTPDCKSDDELLQKAPKAGLSTKSKVKAAAQGSDSKSAAVFEQPGPSSLQINPSIGRLSCLPPEIDDKTCLKSLSMTSKALYSLAIPRLFKSIERICSHHVHIAKLIKTTEPFLGIEQRKQLKTEGIYKGQQETFPDDVDPKMKPEIANYVRRALIETGDPGKRHRYIVHRYVEELLKNLDNLELWGGMMLTESMAKSLSTKKDLKALWLNTNVPMNSEFHDIDALGALKDMKHLSIYKDGFWGRRGWRKSSPEMLIWNSRSTLQSLALNESTFHHMHFEWEESGQEPPRQGYLSVLKSFSLVEGEFDDEQTNAILHAIDFVKLQELTLGRRNTRMGLLYRRLTEIFSTARGNIKLRSLYMDLQEDADEGIEFLSTFDTLTRLTICDNGIYPGDPREPGPEEPLFRGLYMHKNLTVLKLTDETYTMRDRMPGLDAQTATNFILNFPNLKHLHFHMHVPQLEEIAEALSHGRNLEKVCAKTHRWGAGVQEKQDTAFRFLHGLARSVLQRASREASFTWEDHSKIKFVVFDRLKFEVGSKFDNFKGAKRAQKIESPWNKKHQILFRPIPMEHTLIRGGIADMRKWADKVVRDLD
ncbi:uncharacterized protein FIESC28_02870 [Fusarium coffeatum]|uniref:Tautomerase cis-CaaD-like domain-containing protein n=1 Tax=Fusarium coffeatum TaxID=231269 RepID=A0A366S6R6_9HYPO|nr:uncharacterized protein FIESC28_02870 [Fusarium coffeatum]RBR24380.1 hypothetical protein FIESC28_02870 [Fusarium coffeatum]